MARRGAGEAEPAAVDGGDEHELVLHQASDALVARARPCGDGPAEALLFRVLFRILGRCPRPSENIRTVITDADCMLLPTFNKTSLIVQKIREERGGSGPAARGRRGE